VELLLITKKSFMRIIKSFKEPQTIVICGLDYDYGFEPSALITDDESGFGIRSKGGIILDVFSYGFVYILTKDEFYEYCKNNQRYSDNDNIENMFIVLNNFVGDVGVTAVNHQGDENDDFELDDYMQHQFDDNLNLLVEVPSGYDVTPRNFKSALALIESEETTYIKDKFLLKKTIFFVDAYGNFDFGRTELSIVDDNTKYNEHTNYIGYDELNEDEDNNLRAKDGYNLIVQTYSYSKLNHGDYIDIEKTLNDYNKLKTTF